mgnify:FL=1
MIIDISKPIECMDVHTGNRYKVVGINLPVGSPSGKDFTIEVSDGEYEWRSVEEVQLIGNVQKTRIGKISRTEYIVNKCFDCKHEQIIPNGIDGKRCEKCDGFLRPIRIMKGGE